MAFTPEQADEIKAQLLEQVDKLPNENKEEIKQHIQSLNEQQLEEFLKQNNINISDSSQPPQGGGGGEQEKPIFASIVAGDIPSYQVAENDKAIAILELNPVSEGHIIILPKSQTTIEKIPKSAMSLAQKMAKKIKTKFKPKDLKIETFSFQDYPAINVIPIYDSMPKERKKADDSVLEKLQKKLQTIKRGPRPKKEKPTKNLKEIPERIPY
jgi:histidine triad (HIT) family protein